MVFAFLFGLSMDYEVFILARMREEYDATGRPTRRSSRGIGRTGRLVTSAALILFLAFMSLASGPGTDVKVLATGLAAGILLDATVIRALLVPAVVSLFGSWNWWMPRAARRSSCASPRPRRRRHSGDSPHSGAYHGGVAVVIASDLAKDMAGEPLLRGVSFKLERRDRLTIAGRNGAGKTTLLRMLAGETSIDGGELVFAKGVRVALHDQRPPRERDVTLRDYVLSGARSEPLRARGRARARSSSAMAAGDETAMNRYADVQARFEAARRLRLARARRPSCTASASPTTTSTARSRRSPAAS